MAAVSTFSSRRPPTRWGWWLIVGGLSCQIPAAVLIALFSDIFLLIGLVGVAGVLVGCWILAGKVFWGVPVGFFAGMAMLLGIALGAEQYAFDRDHRTATCQVTEVAKYFRTTGTRDSRGNYRSGFTETWYRHTARCPDGTHTLNSKKMRPEGEAIEVVYDPRGSEPPSFAGQGSRWPLSLIPFAIGAPILLVIPFVAWRRGRRPWTPPPLRTPVGPTPWPGAAPPGQDPGSGAPPPYRHWT